MSTDIILSDNYRQLLPSDSINLGNSVMQRTCDARLQAEGNIFSIFLEYCDQNVVGYLEVK
jgi:hypothetical protein